VTNLSNSRYIKLRSWYAIGFIVLGLIVSGITYLLSQFFNSVIVFLVVLPLVGIAGWILGNKLAEPINSFLSTTNQIVNINIKHRVDLRTRASELNQLAKNFYKIADQLSLSMDAKETKSLIQGKEMEEVNLQLQRQVGQYKAVSAVASAMASLQDPENILPQITKLICEHFGYYHVGIFLVNKSNEYALLMASNSEGGQRMLKRGHRLKVGLVGIVGYVTGSGDPRIAFDTGEDAVFFENPDLPNTHSEMALPLKIGSSIIGALDVQSTETNVFSKEDVAILLTLANQIAIAIQNDRLFQETRKSLSDIEAINRQYIQNAWQNLPVENDLLGYQFNSLGSSSIKITDKLETLPSEGEQKYYLSIPIQLRGVKIGNLKINKSKEHNFSRDQVDIANAIADRVAISLENARLLEETSRVAQRERTVGEITTKIRSNNDPQAMIQTALEELKKVLHVEQITISSIIPKIVNDDLDAKNSTHPQN
jgi:GAF domain-containing protein/HAMP domain-containing protein